MVCNNEATRDNEEELSIQMFSKAADDIAACGNDLLLVAEAIAQSCHMIGSASDDCREVLWSRANNFKALADLYKTKSKRFEDIVKSLEGGLQDVAVLF